MIPVVNARMDPDLVVPMHRLAVDLVMPAGPRIESAVVLAEDLVTSGFSGPATVEVATLRRDALRSDAEPQVRKMLTEHGIDVPIPADEDAECRLLLTAFGFWDLPLADFYSPFLHRLPLWDEQDDLERTLNLLLDDLDHITDPTRKREVVDRMRSAVRDALK